MANIQYITKNSFIIEARLSRLKFAIIGIIPSVLILFGLYIVFDNNIFIALISCIVIIYILGMNMLKAGEMARKSGKTELKLYKYLKKLPETFIIFNQIEIPSNKSSWGSFELDFLVVSPSAIYIIEVKHFSGKILGTNTGTWKSIKTDQYGIEHEKEQKSPFYQLSYQSEILRKFLNKYDISPNIIGLVYLDIVDKDPKLPKNPKYNIFTNKDIIKHINKIEKLKQIEKRYNSGNETYYNTMELFRLVKNKTIT